ncbi:unnamed protein product [Didymodactylos carnosus]|uniref:ADP ribosyltransferase domain-containing protein n=1 Tax=Didymodactylos carnosus TaxID=1234261 RepID=A0A815AG48_9BILA|nr:unnamed protein product [Didymodactylos carnosus]CAF1510633.1 unnamed protein product [Didymodactylos carnosus]CAF4025503.1 unnamed protein product [Didymodactylos carnosus]CAF4298542.1 unnamed protein product [Didymodactylos carnosus]
MDCCIHDTKTRRYLPPKLSSAKEDYENEYFHYDQSTELISMKLLETNPYTFHLKQVYPTQIEEYQLTEDMLNVLRTYTNSSSGNDCYIKTNLNLLTNNDIDWTYTNKLYSIIKGLCQNDIRHVYYRGLHLSDAEIRYYMAKINDYYYTNSFYSFTIDRLLTYSGNAIIILKITPDNRLNIANIWKWSHMPEEKEAILSIGSKLKVLSVHYFGYKWEIEVELVAEDAN